jgi:hypothetical protein
MKTNPIPPYALDGQGISYLLRGIPLHQEQVGQQARGQSSSVGQVEAGSDESGRGAEGFRGGESAFFDEEREFVVLGETQCDSRGVFDSIGTTARKKAIKIKILNLKNKKI